VPAACGVALAFETGSDAGSIFDMSAGHPELVVLAG
jgi:hypothetical protein